MFLKCLNEKSQLMSVLRLGRGTNERSYKNESEFQQKR